MKHIINIEQLASFSLRMTGEYCSGTMIAQYAANNPHANDSEINEVTSLIEEFIQDAF